jgi:hypothetical protein
VRIRRGKRADGVHRELGLVELQRALGRADEHQHAFGALHVHTFEQRAGHGLLGRDAGTVRAAGHGRAHHGLTGLAHDRAHVLEVHVHQGFDVDDFGNPADGVLQHVVGLGKSLVLGHVVAQHLQQLVVEHDDEGIDVLLQLGQAGIGVLHAAATLPVERLGHHADGEDAHVLGDFGDHRRCPRAGATAHARGDEQHVRAADGFADVGLGHFRGGAAFFRLAAGAQAGLPELDDAVRRSAGQGLGIGIGADKFDALHVALDHVLDRVAAAPADANHLDLGAPVELLDFDHFNAHLLTP